jgi:hypothetical protein
VFLADVVKEPMVEDITKEFTDGYNKKQLLILESLDYLMLENQVCLQP